MRVPPVKNRRTYRRVHGRARWPLASGCFSYIKSLAVSCLLLCWLSGCARGPSPLGDIILITVDTLRADHMGIYGYSRQTTPKLNRFFKDGVVFERSYATSSYTPASIVSILSGLLPQDHRVRLFDQLLPEGCELVTELLPVSYQRAAFVSNGVLSDGGLGIAARFDHFDDEMERRADTHSLERSARATTDAVILWLQHQCDPGRPLFLWVHYMDPHTPYTPPKAWSSAFDWEMEGSSAPQPVVGNADRPVEAKALGRIDDYDREIAYTDAEIGRLFQSYAELRELDEALILFTADHGETLVERTRRFQHAYHVFEELVRVPLLMRGPDVDSSGSERLVSGVDLLPTMLAFAGKQAAPDLPGTDLRASRSSGEKAVVFVESIHRFDGNQWRAAIGQKGKWLVRVRQGPQRIVQKGFWDLASDPEERVLRPWRDGEGVGERLLELASRDPDPAGKPSEYRKGVLTQQNVELLQAMGYVE